MGRGKATFRMSDLRRAREIASESGETVEVTRDGTIRIVPAKPGEASGASKSAANPWDKVLSNDADEKRPS